MNGRDDDWRIIKGCYVRYLKRKNIIDIGKFSHVIYKLIIKEVFIFLYNTIQYKESPN